MRYLFTALLALVLIGSDCQPGPPDPPTPPNPYCASAVVQPEPTAYESVVDAVAGVLATIIGGEPSTDRRATVLVILPGGYCSGTVVGKRTVLTAAHCETPTMSVRIDGQVIQASSIQPHPNYTGRYPYNDLLLLHFSQDLPGPIVDTVYKAGTEGCEELIAQGWGKSETPQVDLNESRYSVIGETSMVLSTKQILPGGICFGDSGGPLYAVVNGELQIAGVTSTTYSQDCLVGGDHVNLNYYRTWLEDNIQ